MYDLFTQKKCTYIYIIYLYTLQIQSNTQVIIEYCGRNSERKKSEVLIREV